MNITNAVKKWFVINAKIKKGTAITLATVSLLGKFIYNLLKIARNSVKV